MIINPNVANYFSNVDNPTSSVQTVRTLAAVTCCVVSFDLLNCSFMVCTFV